jgi:hypothetical protein
VITHKLREQRHVALQAGFLLAVQSAVHAVNRIALNRMMPLPYAKSVDSRTKFTAKVLD